jgi:hypothetical protein
MFALALIRVVCEDRVEIARHRGHLLVIVSLKRIATRYHGGAKLSKLQRLTRLKQLVLLVVLR